MTNQSLHTAPIPAWREDLRECYANTGRMLPATMHPQQVEDFYYAYTAWQSETPEFQAMYDDWEASYCRD